MHRCMWVKNRSPGVSGAHFAQDDEILKDMDDKSVHSLAQHGSNSLKKKKNGQSSLNPRINHQSGNAKHKFTAFYTYKNGESLGMVYGFCHSSLEVRCINGYRVAVPWPVFWSETLESMSNSPVMSRRLSNHCISNKRLPSGKLT